MIVDKITDLIGNTPMFRFQAEDFGGKTDTTILAKLEFLEPGGSIKDRLGKYLIQEGLRTGKMNKETIIIEATAGNTGIGLALASIEYGLKTIFVVPEKFSVEKQKIMRALGAEIIHTPTSQGMRGAIEKAKELHGQMKNSYLPEQFFSVENPRSYQILGKEILEESNGRIDSFVAGVGSGGTLSGVGEYLRSFKKTARIVGVEPEGSILNGGAPGDHKIEGIGVEFVPRFFDEMSLDKVYTISDPEGFRMTRLLAEKFGLLVGSSSGAAFSAAVEESKILPSNSQILTIFPDGSERYLSKNIYDPFE
jgi:cysteine synthase A